MWGGELLVGSATEFVRAGHLWPVRLPGGERAIQQPWRMACSWLQEALGEPAPPLAGIARHRWDAVAELARTGVAAPVTTSMGRLFDAVAALCGIRTEIRYEGQAAIELEAAAEAGDHGRYELPLADDFVLDTRPLVLAVWRDAAAGTPAGVIAARFHDTIADATADAVTAAAGAYGLGTAVLSGGVFLNRRLLAATVAALQRAGLRVLVPERLPPGDGGISYGQAAVAAAQDR
jgi:hydrogenase maturation protein HypF